LPVFFFFFFFFNTNYLINLNPRLHKFVSVQKDE